MRPIQITISDYGIIVISREGSMTIHGEGLTLRKEDPVLQEIAKRLKIDIEDLVDVLKIFNRTFPKEINNIEA